MEENAHGSDGTGQPTWHHLGKKVSDVSASIQSLTSKETIEQLKNTVHLNQRMREHPYGTLALAAGIGYILGGGLFSGLTRRLVGRTLRIGLRLAVVPLLRDQLLMLMPGGHTLSSSEEGTSRSSEESRD